MTFSTPEELFRWHLEHWDTDERDDYAEVGDTRCPWCNCRIYRLYHESGCPVRALIDKHQRGTPSISYRRERRVAEFNPALTQWLNERDYVSADWPEDVPEDVRSEADIALGDGTKLDDHGWPMKPEETEVLTKGK